MPYYYLYMLFLMMGTSSLGSKETEPSLDEPFAFPESPVETYQESQFLGEFFYMLLMLGILIGVVLVASWFLKRLLNNRLEQQNVTSSIKILERRSLSQKTTLFLIESDDQTILIAETHTTVVPLHIQKNESLQS